MLDGQPYADWSSYVGLSVDSPGRSTVEVLALPDVKYGLLFSTPEGHVTRLRPDRIALRQQENAAKDSA